MADNPAPAEAGSSEPEGSPSESMEAAEPAPADAKAEPDSGPPEVRNVTYRVTDQGLLVEVAGVRFKPMAKAVKNSKGGYEVELTVMAESMDDDSHVLLSPENGPLAFAATIYNKNGSEQAHHGDTREGGEQEFIIPGAAIKLQRSWPSGSVKGPLWWGQKLKLYVGLWGLGAGADSERKDAGRTRPVRKLFVVEMTAGAKPKAIITPPDVEAGN